MSNINEDNIVIKNNALDELKKLQESISPEGDQYNYFNRFRMCDSDPFTSNVGYIFFTKPDLNIDTEKNLNGKLNLSQSNYFDNLDLSVFGRSILGSLSNSYSKKTDSSNFIKILSNNALNFETKDTTIKTDDLYQDYVGYKMTLPYTFIESITADTISFNFFEYADLRVTHLIKAWVTYMHNIKRGIFVPTKNNRNTKILDYACSIFFFLCGPDGRSIKYFTKLTGCFPLNIPYNTFTWEFGGNPEIKKLSVTFQYQVKEDLEPEILDDFLKITDITYKDTGNVNDLSGRLLTNKIKDNWAKYVTIRNSSLLFYS